MPLISNNKTTIMMTIPTLKSTLIISLAILFNVSFAYSQKISRSVITVAGGYMVNEEGISVSWSMGQVFSLTTLSEQHLTEGFQQGDLEATGTVILNANRQNTSTVLVHFDKKGIINSTDFQLQRRHSDEQDFVNISTINNSAQVTAFEYVDNNSSDKNTAYRILFINNKNHKTSNVATVVGTPRAISMTVFPNPTVEQINIQLSNPTNEVVTVIIWDINGKVAFQNKYQSTDNQLINISHLDQLTKGTYIVSVNNETTKIGSETFIKM